MNGRAPARLARWIALAPLAALAASPACAPAVPNGAPAEALPAISSRDAVVRVGAYAIVPAVAVSQSRAFVVGEDGVAVYDRGGRAYVVDQAGRLPGERHVLVAAPGRDRSHQRRAEVGQRAVARGHRLEARRVAERREALLHGVGALQPAESPRQLITPRPKRAP